MYPFTTLLSLVLLTTQAYAATLTPSLLARQGESTSIPEGIPPACDSQCSAINDASNVCSQIDIFPDGVEYRACVCVPSYMTSLVQCTSCIVREASAASADLLATVEQTHIGLRGVCEGIVEVPALPTGDNDNNDGEDANDNENGGSDTQSNENDPEAQPGRNSGFRVKVAGGSFLVIISGAFGGALIF